MGSDVLVDEAAKRLMASSLMTTVRGLQSAEVDGVETLLLTIDSDTPAQTRQLLAQLLTGLPFEWVEGIPRGAVHALNGVKDQQTWRIGTQAEVDWIQDNTAGGLTVTSAIPPMFEAYATVVIPEDPVQRGASESALLRLLAAHCEDQPWWLGYLDTGLTDLVFDHAPKVTLYADWSYVLVEAGPHQAASWRGDDPWRGRLPEVIYPADRSWLVSKLWDDDWRCLGAPGDLIRAVLAEPRLDARSVNTDQDATPPGHVAH